MTAICYALAWAVYLGFQATIRFVVYPQFERVPSDGFRRYELAHQRRVGRLVTPLFACLALATAALLLRPPAGLPPALLAASALPLAVVLGATIAGAVPEHRVLSNGFDGASYRRLLRVDSLRLAASVTGLALALVML